MDRVFKSLTNVILAAVIKTASRGSSSKKTDAYVTSTYITSTCCVVVVLIVCFPLNRNQETRLTGPNWFLL